MKIGVFEIESWEREAFENLSQEHELVFDERELDAEIAKEYADLDIASVFIYSSLDAEVLQQFSQLKLITTRSTGVDHIDADYCREHGIAVASVPDYGTHTVAEHVFALLLAISHKLIEAVDRTRRGDFSQQGLVGFDLAGRTLGVVGTGDIGQHTARIAKGFGMKVLAYDVEPRDELADEIGFRYVELAELLANSDVVSLHVPGSEKTENLIGAEEFAKMKHGSVLINTARGNIVDTRAMLRALADGTLRAAGLDVLDEEPIVREEAELLHSYHRKSHKMESILADHILLRVGNVIVTPHTAFNTKEAVERILQTTRENIVSFIEGEAQNRVVSPKE
ncbi:hydroxyacid dehydrogenase [Thioalkalivibrio sp.]|uniref:hydroxyacid dehydrogenase n=1 Tax=Thioalkalivibrio sp. TaxID=2093813 RepID=UPI0012D4F23C|nr:hydroxyacid dehydrogenase [Thioalkalivibrio sp.]TVP80302.1 MAG: hydroxyacid dehydrogenase [Thioalkalivibrio sp.]